MFLRVCKEKGKDMPDKTNGENEMGIILEKECGWLCQEVFGFKPDASIVRAYQEAHRIVFTDAEISLWQTRLARAVEKYYDLEAVEYAWRVRDKNNPLSKKMQILFYLVETDRRYFHLFVNRRKSWFKACLVMAYQGVRSAYKVTKGTMLLKTKLFRELIHAHS